MAFEPRRKPSRISGTRPSSKTLDEFRYQQPDSTGALLIAEAVYRSANHMQPLKSLLTFPSIPAVLIVWGHFMVGLL